MRNDHAPQEVRVSVLNGPALVLVSGEQQPLTRAERKLLTVLVLRDPRSEVERAGKRASGPVGGRVSSDELEEALAELGQSTASLRTHVANLRRKLGGKAGLPDKTDGGFTLGRELEADLWTWLEMCRLGESNVERDPAEAVRALDAAHELWPNPHLPEFFDTPLARGAGEAVLLRRDKLMEVRLRLLIDHGREEEATAILGRLVSQQDGYPCDSHWVLYMEAEWAARGATAALAVFDRAWSLYEAEGLKDYFPRELEDIRKRSERSSSRPNRRGPVETRVSTSSLPSTSDRIVGREQELESLSRSWADPRTSIVQVVAWAGVGKSALANDWLRAFAEGGYGDAERVFGWSFYRQGTDSTIVSSDLFMEAALRWFGDDDPSAGSAWERGVRLARLVMSERTLLVLDGLEPLQAPPGADEGSLRDRAIAALLRELTASSEGLVILSTRVAVADLAAHEGSALKTIRLGHLSPEAGASLLRAMGVRGTDAELHQASVDYGNHALALTLLGSYLDDAFDGDVRMRSRVRGLETDIRLGGHARRVLDSYSDWFGAGPELEILRMLGLFDRAVDEATLRHLSSGEPIDGLTTHVSSFNTEDWRRAVSRLRRASLIARRDQYRPELLDTHPLVREHFGAGLRALHEPAWIEGNARLYRYFAEVSVEYPSTTEEIEPLFQSVSHACRAGKSREALQDVYLPRIMRGDEWFAARQQGLLTSLAATVAEFFADAAFGELVDPLSESDELVVLLEAASYVSALRGYASPEVGHLYTRAEGLAERLGRDHDACHAALGVLRFQRFAGRLPEALRTADRLRSGGSDLPARDRAAVIREIASTLFYVGRFREVVSLGREVLDLEGDLRGGEMDHLAMNDPLISCLGYSALANWFLGYPNLAERQAEESIAQATSLGHEHTRVISALILAMVRQFRGDGPGVSEAAVLMRELSLQSGFAQWNIASEVFSAWSRGLDAELGPGADDLGAAIDSWIGEGARLFVPYFYGMLADVMSRSDNHDPVEALDAALEFGRQTGEVWWDAELHRLKGVAHGRRGETEAQIEHLDESLTVAKRQDAFSLAVRSAVDLLEAAPSAAHLATLAELIAGAPNEESNPDLERGRTALRLHGNDQYG